MLSNTIDFLWPLVFTLSVLVFFHELGHFLAAKLFGVRVERFSIGFPPRLFGKKIGETDYCISAIPFGGYVKLSGMIDESLDAEGLKGEPYEFMSKKTYQKIVIISAGVFVNFLLAVFILAGIYWLKGEKIDKNTTIGQIQQGSLAEEIGFRKYDKIVKINGVEILSWNDVTSTLVSNIGNDIDFTVERDGKPISLHLDASKSSLDNLQKLALTQFMPAIVGGVVPDYPAQKAGLQTGDKIVAINGKPVSEWYDMTEIIRASAEKPLTLSIERNNKLIDLTITPKKQEEKTADGQTIVVGKIGISPEFSYEWRTVPLGPSIVKGFNQIVFFLSMNIKGFAMLLTGQASARESLGGPIAIGKMVVQTARLGFVSLLEMTALLSAILAFINILPIPALDGGHLMIIIIEAVRKKPISVATKVKIQQVGMALLLMLMVFVIYNDISRMVR